jgi:hypothetical protein
MGPNIASQGAGVVMSCFESAFLVEEREPTHAPFSEIESHRRSLASCRGCEGRVLHRRGG